MVAAHNRDARAARSTGGSFAAARAVMRDGSLAGAGLEAATRLHGPSSGEAATSQCSQRLQMLCADTNPALGDIVARPVMRPRS